MDTKQTSFSAASVFPAKLLRLKAVDKNKKIMPLHIQLNPTNICNFNCSFCSCSGRAKTLKMSFEDIKEIMVKAKKCGTKAVTITGGGEPLTHPQINEIVALHKELGIKVGLVSNGTLIKNLNQASLDYITWIRFSSSDWLETQLAPLSMTLFDWFSGISKAVERGKNVDWAFSYVLTSKPKYNILQEIIDCANEFNFTHVRVVSDLFDLENVPDMSEVKKNLKNDELVVYQGRKDQTKGAKKCLISLLKPVIGADGKIYPCCGTQYALANPGKDYEKSMCMGDGKDIDKIFEEQKYFDGSVCVKCYYSEYNFALEAITCELKHKEFV